MKQPSPLWNYVCGVAVFAAVFSLLLAGHWRRQASRAGGRQAELERRLAELKGGPPALAPSPAPPEGKRLVSEAEFLELMRLRSEVAQLRREVAEQARNLEMALRAAQATNVAAAAQTTPADIVERDPSEWANGIPRGEWSYRAHGSPEAAIETIAWAMREGNVDLFLDSLTPKSREQMLKELNAGDPSELAKKIQDDLADTHMLMLGVFKERTDDRATFTVVSHQGTRDDGARFKSEQVMRMVRGQSGWRLSLDGEEE